MRTPSTADQEEGRFGRRHGSRASPEYRHVYFIEATSLGVVKIGCADDARKRLAQLQVGCPDELALRGVYHTDDAPRLEAAYHDRFAAQHVRGEWFRINGEIRELMDDAFDPEADPVLPLCFKPRQPAPGSVVVYAHTDERAEDLSRRVCLVAQTLGHEVAFS